MLVVARVRVLAVIAVLAAAGLLAGCGSSAPTGRVSAKAYVKSLCSAVIPFERAVVAHGTLLNKASANSPAKSKAAVHAFFSAVASDTATAAAKVHRAGTPNVANGKRISGSIATAFDQVGGAMRQAANRSASLPTNSRAAFQTAVVKLFKSFTTSVGHIGQSLQSNTLSSPELKKASASTPACKSLSPSS